METTTTAPIVVGVDGSASSLDALRRAAVLAQALDTSLRVVTTWDYPAMLEGGYSMEGWSPEGNAQEILSDALLEAFDGAPPTRLTSAIRQGSATTILVDESSRAHMLVLGSRGQGGIASLLLGSVSAYCAQHAHSPVLIVRGDMLNA